MRFDVFYPGTWSVGGAESYTLHLVRSLLRHADVRLLVTSPPIQGSLRAELRIDSVDVETVLLRSASETSLHEALKGADGFFNMSPWNYPRPPADVPSVMVAYYAPPLEPRQRGRVFLRRAAALLRPDRVSWPDPRAAVSAYDDVLGASCWTCDLVSTRWDRPSHVLYPAVVPIAPSGTPDEKENVVLTVGRIAAGGTNKGHAMLIETFNELELPGWRLVIAGAANYDASLAAASHLETIGDGRVDVIVNPSFDQLSDLYRRAAIYWHGAGWGSESDSIENEHFGISLVEAMSAAAAPLAYAGGGPIEILKRDLPDSLWSDLDQLKSRTVDLATDGAQRNAEAMTALDVSGRFGLDAFDDAVDRCLARIRR